ncbi:MAG TPA: PIN domain-containing protein [Jatrophihabitantaceae bacterium]|nr:PIN domain-containing protein [Jatrophihabitantaceae bacterium]
MAVTGYLLDKSVLARVDKPAVSAALQPFLGRLATCSTVLLEVGWSATSSAHYRQMMDDLGWYELLDIDQPVLDLATRLQRDLVARGHHRGPGVADLILAATAITHGATLLHYDHDFDVIAEVADRFSHRWIVPRGTAD